MIEQKDKYNWFTKLSYIYGFKEINTLICDQRASKNEILSE